MKKWKDKKEKKTLSNWTHTYKSWINVFLVAEVEISQILPHHQSCQHQFTSSQDPQYGFFFF